MTTLAWPAYAAAFLAPLALAWVLTPLMLRIAVRRRILDGPTAEARKAQQDAIPYLGGVAIVAGILIVFVFLDVFFKVPAHLFVHLRSLV